MIQRTVQFSENDVTQLIYGRRDRNLQVLETQLGVDLQARGAEIQLEGEDNGVEFAEFVLEQLYLLARDGRRLTPDDVSRAIRVLEEEPDRDLRDIFNDEILVAAQNKIITPKGINQKDYVDSIRGNDIVFGIGPAGTGKTYLAMAMALASYFDHRVKRIILVRPAVEAGENLGFLPGDIAEKVNPYLRPLHDAIDDMVNSKQAEKMMEQGDVEVAPLAFMRGRTLNDSFIIMDEAQNTTPDQMKMFLTRLGFGSKAVITGDITQVDLPGHVSSGLVTARQRLEGIRGIEFCEFSEVDVVRHPLVEKIINAYDESE